MELVEALDEGDQHQAQGHHGLEGNAQQLVGHHAQDLEDRVEVPLRKDFQGSGKRIGLIQEHGGIKHSQANNAANGPEDHHREHVEQVVGPGGLTVIVVTHALGELGAQGGVGEVGLFKDVHG